MPDPFSFIVYPRENPPRRPVEERIRDWHEVEQMLPPGRLEHQALRCMDCGVPFCEMYGCPLRNRIPDWISMVCGNNWRMALELLHSTDNFPEITGRVCPAPCEPSCTLSINGSPVTIKHIELQIAERGWREGWIEPLPALNKTGEKIAIIGSGPAGLTAAQQMARYGHSVTVFDRDRRIGGILRYGIPEFMLEKWVLDRRIDQMRREGVIFETGVDVGVDLSIGYLKRTFDSVVIITGSRIPYDLQVPGRKLDGIYFAYDFLACQNRRLSGDTIPPAKNITAEGREVVIIGGGDTGAYCIGVSRRQGALGITQAEIESAPPENGGIAGIQHAEPLQHTWPLFSGIPETTGSHDEGCNRLWGVKVKKFLGKKGRVSSVILTHVGVQHAEPLRNGNNHEIPGAEFEIPADMVILAMGFVHMEQGPLIQNLSLVTDEKMNLKINDNYMTSSEGIFAAGDCVLGGSSVVQAMHQGREVAEAVNGYLMD
ncbi:MAG: glutamate synthase subunit beta [Candidatus Latescibacter sp.]|nr:glutamate synthase subunit beta [Candidatus Latescibacter sp.]